MLEIIGLILSFGGLGAIIARDITETDEVDEIEVEVSWMDLSKRLLQASGKCLQFCSDYGHLNDLGVNLMLMNLILHT